MTATLRQLFTVLLTTALLVLATAHPAAAASISSLKKKLLKSDDWREQAGAATCIGSIIRTQMRDWKTAVPGEANYRVAHEKIRASYRHLAPTLIQTLKSEQRDVRAASMGALLAIGANTPGVAKAILALAADPDPYIADQAMINLEKNGGVDSLDTKTRVAGLARALQGQLPRGRGHVMRMIQRLPEEERKMLIPAMLKNAAWSPTRDMMFSLAGRDAAIKLLTQYRAKELITLIPEIIQAKERFVDQLKASAIPSTVIRPTGFFSDMLEFLNMAGKGRVRLFGTGRYRINPISGEDLAGVCIQAMEHSTGELDVGGPEVLTHRQIARLAFEVLDRKERITTVPLWIVPLLLWGLRLTTSVQTYGPVEFLMTALTMDTVAPEYGSLRLRDFFMECRDSI